MNHKFDFDQVGRRMPYTVPDGAFAAMEAEVMNRVHRQQSVRRRMWWYSAAAAVVVAAIAIGAVLLRLDGGALRNEEHAALHVRR